MVRYKLYYPVNEEELLKLSALHTKVYKYVLLLIFVTLFKRITKVQTEILLYNILRRVLQKQF